MNEQLQFVLLGIGAGAIYVLIAQGLVLVYRGSGIINFAQGAFGMAAAYLYYAQFRDLWGWSEPLSMAVALVIVGVFGALVYLAIVHRLRHASALTRTIATLGVLILLDAIFALRYTQSFYLTISPLPQNITHLGSYHVGEDRLWLFGIAVISTAVLWLLSRFTVLGLATSAASENEESASALGWSPDLIGAVNWAVGATFAGAAAILISPVTGLNVSSLTFLVVSGLAVALIGDFVSFPAALVAGMGLGILESLLVSPTVANYLTHNDIPQEGVSKALPFFVIVVVLMLRGKALPVRGHVFDRLPALGSGRIRIGPLVGGVAVLVVLLNLLQNDWVGAITSSLIVGLLMMSLVVLTGYTGQISLAQYALAGLGAWAAARLVAAQQWPFEFALLAGIGTAMVVGLVFAIPALRTRGVSLAIVTLGLGIAAQQLVYANQSYTGGVSGTVVGAGRDPLRLFGINIDSIEHPTTFAMVVLAALVLVALMIASIRRSRSGRRLIAVRTNERAAAALGISVFGAKMYAFAVASGIAGLGGVLLAFRDRNVRFDQFDPFSSITLLAYAVIGGIGFIVGPLLGSGFAQFGVVQLLGDKIFGNLIHDFAQYVVILGGLALFAIILYNPDGLSASLVRRLAPLRTRTRRRPPPDVAGPLPEPQRTRVRPATLDVQALCVRFGGVVALDGVSLQIRPGEVVGLIGPNGAGKTSFVDAVTGFVRPSSGVVLLNDEDIGRRSTHRRVRAGISRSFQSLELFEDLTVRDNLRTASDDRDAMAYLTNLVAPRNRPLGAAAVAAIHEFGLGTDLDRPPPDLSFGRRRLVAIARAVAVQPSILLLDEPAAGLGDAETRELSDLVRRLADDWGIGVLVIEHDMAFVMGLCDRLVVLDFGRQIASGRPEQIQRNPDVIRAYLGDEGDDPSLAPQPAMAGPVPEESRGAG
jgi:sulfate-transporting ATPase